MVSIRITTLGDLSDLRRAAVETQFDTFGAHNSEENMNAFLRETYSLEKLGKELLEPGSLNYVAFEEDELAGFMRLRASGEVEHLLGTNTIELQRLYVHPKFQGRKIGAALMNKALTFASDSKYAWIWLGVWEGNFKALEFYARWGFEQFSEHIFQMGEDAQTDWLMRRKVWVVSAHWAPVIATHPTKIKSNY